MRKDKMVTKIAFVFMAPIVCHPGWRAKAFYTAKPI